MVPLPSKAPLIARHSPRIRGDGPSKYGEWLFNWKFSPYSRGWSPSGSRSILPLSILPVFAGMVPFRVTQHLTLVNSPRIRGDGPTSHKMTSLLDRFSPYSRGWSLVNLLEDFTVRILPVFAGMVPMPSEEREASTNSPRIRGDGPECGL